MSDEHEPLTPKRRSFIAASGAGMLAALSTRTATGATAAPSALTPQLTEGPFYFDAGLVRSDVTEDRHGASLDVRIAVTDARGTPLSGFRVDLWHCDATGVYSGYAAQGRDAGTSTRGKTFLRGTVLADRDGLAVFRTIYPGWYEGRAPHIHYKVFDGDRLVLTSQLFLPDALSEYLYTSVAAYRRSGLRDTLNRSDGIAREAGHDAFAAVREDADRYVLVATAIVDPQARVPKERRPGPQPGQAARRSGQGRENGPPPVVGDRGPDPFRARPAALEGEARVAAIVPRVE